MPHSDLHKTKLKKNIAVFAIVIGLMALIWAVTMIKIANGVPDGEQNNSPLIEKPAKGTTSQE